MQVVAGGALARIKNKTFVGFTVGQLLLGNKAHHIAVRRTQSQMQRQAASQRLLDRLAWGFEMREPRLSPVDGRNHGQAELPITRMPLPLPDEALPKRL